MFRLANMSFPIPWLLLSLVSIIVTNALTMTPKNMITAAKTTKPGCQRKCGNLTIPYPFGIGHECYLEPYFGIRCDASYNPPKAFPLVPFGSDIDILDITETQVMVRNKLIVAQCYDSKGNEIESPVSKGISHLDVWNSPFTISHTSNKLTVIGCDDYALVGVSGGTFVSKEDAWSQYRAGCFALCGRPDEVILGSCSGSGCCQTDIPVGLQVASISLQSLNNRRNSTEINGLASVQPCSYGFFAGNDSFRFGGASDLTTTGVLVNRTMQQVPLVLDWAVQRYGDGKSRSCNQAKRNSTTYLCKSNTKCIDSDVGGYLCRCISGYEGNPYLEPGCTDVDECAGSNTCSMVCINTPGSYRCSCPSGYSGDGLKFGTGCTKSQKNFNNITLGLGISLGAILLLLLGWWFSTIIAKRRIIKQKAQYFERNGGLLLQQQMATDESVVARIKIFTIDELERATDHFNKDRILGKGGQGTVYKGMLSEGKIVAIKKSEKIDESQLGEFINEVVILSQINHKNIVKLLGCCLETEVPLLVYEYIPNGTLFHQIHHPSEDFSITWKMRLQIASDVAGALAYLHTSSSIPIFHRDIKSSNILLDDKYRAKLSDFGTSKSVAIDQTHVTTRVMGTFGYLDPEYFQSSQFTEKSDVYSFGVVLVELLTGQKAIRSEIEEERSLASWFLSHLENSNLLDIIDTQILQEGSREEFLTIANIGKQCLNLDGKRRPTMKEVLMEIEGIMLLHLPRPNEQNGPIQEQIFSGTTKDTI